MSRETVLFTHKHKQQNVFKQIYGLGGKIVTTILASFIFCEKDWVLRLQTQKLHWCKNNKLQ